MIITKKVKTTTEKVMSLQCDSCKKNYSLETTEGELEIQEFLHITLVGGYGSIIGDMTSINADICQHCLVEHLGHALNVEKY